MPRETVAGYFRDIAVFAVPAIPAGQKPWQLKDWRNRAEMSAEAMDFYWENFLNRVVRTAGQPIPATFNTISIDSYEVGHQNWNKDFARSFIDATGYDLRKVLPVVTGRVVGSTEFTERVLWDYRKVVGALIAKNYSGRMAERCHAAGLQFANEPCGSYGNTSDLAWAPTARASTTAIPGGRIANPGTSI